MPISVFRLVDAEQTVDLLRHGLEAGIVHEAASLSSLSGGKPYYISRDYFQVNSLPENLV